MEEEFKKFKLAIDKEKQATPALTPEREKEINVRLLFFSQCFLINNFDQFK